MWVNTTSKVYKCSGTKNYGTIKNRNICERPPQRLKAITLPTAKPVRNIGSSAVGSGQLRQAVAP